MLAVHQPARDRGSRNRPPRSSWPPGRTRFTSGSLGTGCKLTRIQGVAGGAGGVGPPIRPLHRWLSRRHWQRRRSPRTVRMGESVPGEVAELDFGRLGYIQDQETGRRRAVWALLVVLAYSRHCFVWPAYGQKLEDVIAGLEAAWAFFGGIPKYLVIDKCPASTILAGSWLPH